MHAFLQTAALAAGCLVTLLTGTQAADITVVTVGGPVPVLMSTLAPAFERASGNKVVSKVDSTPEVLRRIKEGEKIDLAIAASEAIEELVKAGNIGGSGVVFRSGVGLAVRAGLAKPNIGSADALKAALLGATSVAYSRGPSGTYFTGLLQRLGIAEAMKPKLVVVESGPVGEAVAKGAAEMGIQQVAELMPIAGIDLVGPMPADVQTSIVYAAGVPVGATQKDAATALLKFFSSDIAVPLLKAKGFNPA
jgi:molybdate transport system substrate-binding protein